MLSKASTKTTFLEPVILVVTDVGLPTPFFLCVTLFAF